MYLYMESDIMHAKSLYLHVKSTISVVGCECSWSILQFIDVIWQFRVSPPVNWQGVTVQGQFTTFADKVDAHYWV